MGGDEKAVARSAEWGTGDKREDGFFSGDGDSGYVGGFNDLFFNDGIGVAGRVVVYVN